MAVSTVKIGMGCLNYDDSMEIFTGYALPFLIFQDLYGLVFFLNPFLYSCSNSYVQEKLKARKCCGW